MDVSGCYRAARASVSLLVQLCTACRSHSSRSCNLCSQLALLCVVKCIQIHLESQFSPVAAARYVIN